MIIGITLLFAVHHARATFNGLNGHVFYSAPVDQGAAWLGAFAIFDGDGSQLTFPTLTAPITSDSEPASSRDGSQIAFIRTDNALGDTFIDIMNADGTNRYSFLSSDSISEAATLSAPTWSADGQMIAFNVSSLAWAEGGLFVIGLDGTGLTRVVANGSSEEQTTFSPEWSPTGRKLAFRCRVRNLVSSTPGQTKADDLCIYDLDAGQVQFLRINLVDGGVTKPLNPFRNIRRPIWTPDGQRLLFVASYVSTDAVAYSTPTISSTGEAYVISEIHSIRTDGTGLKRLTRAQPVVLPGVRPVVNAERRFHDAVIAPDGEAIIAVATSYAAPNVTSFGIWAMNADGSGQTLVTKLAATASSAQSRLGWQSLAAHPGVYVTDGHGHPLDGLEVELRSLTDELVDDQPVHSGNGTYVFTHATPGHYAVRVQLVDHSGPEGSTPAFDIRHAQSPGEPAWIDVVVDLNSTTLAKSVPFADGPDVFDSNIATEERGHLDDMANVYYHTSRYVAWVKKNLQASLGDDTVEFYTFATTDIFGDPVPPTRKMYNRVATDVTFGITASEYENRDGRPDSGHSDDSPENGEWHEFTHHLTHRFVRDFADCVSNGNHWGYINPSTCDSMKEGLASFFPAAASRDIAGATDSWYDDIDDLEDHSKAWENRMRSPPDVPGETTEDLAVAALMWDVLDANVDTETTEIIDADGVHRLYTLRDDVSMGVGEIWSRLTAGHPLTVFDLHTVLATPATGTAAVTVNLDGLGPADVAPIDLLFLMHGFYDATYDTGVPSNHSKSHYDVGAAQRLDPAGPRNALVGATDHFAYDVAGTQVGAIVPRRDVPVNADARLNVQVRDASGTPLSGATLYIERPTTGFLTTTTPPVRYGPSQVLPSGDGAMLHFEAPSYFDFPLAQGAPLPACDAPGVTRINVTLSATLNGYASTNQPTFDNCEFWQAVYAGIIPAVSVTLTFPADSTPPVTTNVTRLVPAEGGAGAFWAAELNCQDPVVGGFASGCARLEYRVDGGPVLIYRNTLRVPTPGAYRLEYRAVDAAGNEEPFRVFAFDTDGDGLDDAGEAQRGTDPNDVDTDDDGVEDGPEVVAGTDPLDPDSDDDGLSDGAEFLLGSNPLDADTDDDGLSDGEEVGFGTAPLVADTDRDGVSDGPDNCRLTYNERQTDADGDGVGNRCDICSSRPNRDQRDTDNDSFGNICDPDFNRSGRVDSNDASLLKARLNSRTAPDQDLDGNGIVDSDDWSILKSMFGLPPGPGTTDD